MRYDSNIVAESQLLRLAMAAMVWIASLTACLAGTYEYYPGSVLRLGGTFNPEDLTVAYPTCLTYDREYAVHRLNRDGGDQTVPLPSGKLENVAAQNELSIQQLRTRESFYIFLDISIAASGHYGFFSASASMHSQNEDAFDSDAFVFGVRGVSTFAEIGLVNPRLTTDAQKLIKEPAAFHERCGREWVSQETRGVLIAVVYTIKNVSKSQRSLLEAAVSGGYNSQGLGVDISGNMTKILKSAFTSNAYSATIHFIGGEGVSDFAQTITNMDDPVSVIKSISEYMAKLKYGNSVPLRLTTGSLDQFISTEAPSGLFNAFNRRIGDLFLSYQEYRSQRTRLWQYLNQDAQSKWGKDLDDQVWRRLEALDGRIGLIEAKAQTCKKAAQYAAGFADERASQIKTKESLASNLRQRRDFVLDFAVGINASLAKAISPNYSGTITTLAAGAAPDKVAENCQPLGKSPTEVETARNALCACLDNGSIYLQSRFVLTSMPHISVFHDHSLAPRSLLYVLVTSDADLSSVKLIDRLGATVETLVGGYDPEQGPIWYGSTLFLDGNGNPPSSDRLPYVVEVTDLFGRTYKKPVVPVN